MKRSEFLKTSALVGTGIVASSKLMSMNIEGNMKYASGESNDELTNYFYTTIDLRPRKMVKGVEEWQLVYTSQLYNTNIGVYAQFDTKNIIMEGDKKATISKITFKILNYRGSANIGFITDGDFYYEKYRILHEKFLEKNKKKDDKKQLALGLIGLDGGEAKFEMKDLNLNR